MFLVIMWIFYKILRAIDDTVLCLNEDSGNDECNRLAVVEFYKLSI